MLRRIGSVVGAGVLLLLLAGCVAEPASPGRRTPNAVELAAVQRTSQAFFDANANTDAQAPWVQLWTSAQFPRQMQNCVAEQSHGQLEVKIGLPELKVVSYAIVGSGSEPNEAEASQIIGNCAAATPLDDRVLRILPSEWTALYSYELTTLRPCLIAHGYEVGRVPSRAGFLKRIRAMNPWGPYDTVTVPSRLAWYRLSDACPALPEQLS